ncbi:hypothetical protein KDX23_30695 [Burkholderia vietnamiensis]|uniref:hypothetical protein n=1 Tax=Burkholderia vietnamiensis TaxID=60552 RepID=UPI001B909B86|nr:hypothetical protein [Burkholderia vietnamiensis]MBR8087085.1 hypothetical protein [Burkholderia vietnamiensis]
MKIGLVPGILLVAAVVGYFNGPVVVVLVIGAIITALAAYVLSRHRAALTIAAAVAFIAISGWLVQDFPEAKQFPLSFLWTDAFLGAVSIVAMILAAVVGIIGPAYGWIDAPQRRDRP